MSGCATAFRKRTLLHARISMQVSRSMHSTHTWPARNSRSVLDTAWTGRFYLGVRPNLLLKTKLYFRRVICLFIKERFTVIRTTDPQWRITFSNWTSDFCICESEINRVSPRNCQSHSPSVLTSTQLIIYHSWFFVRRTSVSLTSPFVSIPKRLAVRYWPAALQPCQVAQRCTDTSIGALS